MEICCQIPNRFLRTGNLARLERLRPIKPTKEILSFVDGNHFQTARAAIANARKNRELPLLHRGPKLIYDSMELD